MQADKLKAEGNRLYKKYLGSLLLLYKMYNILLLCVGILQGMQHASDGLTVSLVFLVQVGFCRIA